MKCSQCSAPVKRGDGRFCAHCGTKLPDVPRITAEDWITHPERFDEAEASERFARAMKAAPPPVSMMGALVPLVFLVFWLAIGSFIIGGAADAGGIFPVAAGGIVGLGALMVLFAVAKAIRFAKSPVDRRVAVVIDERTKMSGGDNTSVTTQYYATLVGRDANRTEFEATGDVAGHVAPGDIGLAVLRMNILVAFHRL